MATGEPQYWKAYCEEDTHPGLWRRWFAAQCIATGWEPPEWSMSKESPPRDPWNKARSALMQMQPGDYIVVQLRDHCVGRIGRIVRKLVEDDEWNPLVHGDDM